MQLWDMEGKSKVMEFHCFCWTIFTRLGGTHFHCTRPVHSSFSNLESKSLFSHSLYRPNHSLDKMTKLQATNHNHAHFKICNRDSQCRDKDQPFQTIRMVLPGLLSSLTRPTIDGPGSGIELVVLDAERALSVRGGIWKFLLLDEQLAANSSYIGRGDAVGRIKAREAAVVGRRRVLRVDKYVADPVAARLERDAAGVEVERLCRCATGDGARCRGCGGG